MMLYLCSGAKFDEAFEQEVVLVKARARHRLRPCESVVDAEIENVIVFSVSCLKDVVQVRLVHQRDGGAIRTALHHAGLCFKPTAKRQAAVFQAHGEKAS